MRARTILCLSLSLTACKKEEAAPAPAPAVKAEPTWPEGTPTVEQVTEKWKADGLEVTAFAPADAGKYGAAQCFSGKVAGADALLCGFSERRQIRKAQETILEGAKGARTVIIEQRRSGQLALIDRGGADAAGKSLDKASSAFMFLR